MSVPSVINRAATALGMLVLAAASSVAVAEAQASSTSREDDLRGIVPERRASHRDLLRALDSLPSAERLRHHHDLLSSRPHVAGTPGDARVIEDLAEAFRRFGLEVEVDEIHVTIPRLVEARVDVVTPDSVSLSLEEPRMPEDPYTDDPALGPGWLAYSGDGDVEAEVVYANYGRREDFEALEDLAVEVTGRIVVARFGHLFRGHKAENAERAGAAGLILYTDPADSGYVRGIPYPEGGWSNRWSIQRGSILTLPYPGDPLTPFVAATLDAERLSPGNVAFPTIPVQPLGWEAASEILSRMRGPAVPDGWQGGLPFAYRVIGGEDLRVRLVVDQELEVRRTANVIARLPGRDLGAQEIVVGCHHDAWSFGASDPNAGSIVLLETARSLAEVARRGARPRRTVVFGNWAAEELGIIGSTEWVEGRLDELRSNAVAYVNLDMAAMGTEFGASAAPELHGVIEEAVRAVPQPGTDLSVWEAWTGDRPEGRSPFGTLGGGSDHVAFLALAGVPSAGLGAWGADGTAYHTAYDTLAWYRQVVGDDYAGARMLSRIVGRVVARLADADVLPLTPTVAAAGVEEAIPDLESRAEEVGVEADMSAMERAARELRATAEPVMDALWRAVDDGVLVPGGMEAVNFELRNLSRLWLDEEGLPERPWYKNLYAAPNPETSYGTWLLPGVRAAIESGDPAFVRREAARVTRVLRLMEERFEILGRMLLPPEGWRNTEEADS